MRNHTKCSPAYGVLEASRWIDASLQNKQKMAVPHDAFVGKQALDLARPITCHLRGIEPGERLPEVLALRQDRPPAEPRLESLQAQLLEQAPVVLDRPTQAAGGPANAPTTADSGAQVGSVIR